jgi:hypothetical protein
MSAIVLMLSWYTVNGPHSYPWAMMKLRAWSPWLVESDRATNSASADDFVTIYLASGEFEKLKARLVAGRDQQD